MPPQPGGGNAPKITANFDLNIQPALQKLNQLTQAANKTMQRIAGGGSGGGAPGRGNVSGQPGGTGGGGGGGGGGGIRGVAQRVLDRFSAAGNALTPGVGGGAGTTFVPGVAQAPRAGGSTVAGAPAGTRGPDATLWQRFTAAQMGAGAVPGVPLSTQASLRQALTGASASRGAGGPSVVAAAPGGALAGRLAARGASTTGIPNFNQQLVNAGAQAQGGSANMRTLTQASRWQNFQQALRDRSPASQAGGQGTAWQGARAMGGQALGAAGGAIGGIGGVVGSKMLWDVAQEVEKIGLRGLARTGKELQADFDRDASQRTVDFLQGTVQHQKAMKDLGDEYQDLSKGYEKSLQGIARDMTRAFDDNTKNFERMNRQAETLQRSARYQQEDYAKAVSGAEDDRRIGMERALRSRDQLERNYGRTVADLDKARARRAEDYGEAIEDINRDQVRTTQDLQKEANRLYEDQAQYEKELGIQQKERLKDLQEQKQDQGLDRAIGGLSLLQAMRSGNLIGILSAVRNLRNLRRQREETDEQIGRGGFTELEQAQQEGARTGFKRRGEDILEAAIRAGENFAERWKDLAQQIHRDTEDDAQARVRAWEDVEDALQGINDQINDIQRAYDAQIDAATTANTRFFEQYAADTTEWYAAWQQLEENHQRIAEDGMLAMHAAWDEADKRHQALLKRQDEMLGKEAERITAYETQVKLADIMLERRKQDLVDQADMMAQQKKMGEAFNILFIGMAITNLAQAAVGIASLLIMLTKGAGAIKAILAGKTAAEAVVAGTEAAATAGKGLGWMGRLGAAGVGVAGGTLAVGIAGETNFLGLGEGTTIPGTDIPVLAPKLSAALGAFANKEGQARAIADVWGKKDDPEVVGKILWALNSGRTALEIVSDPGTYLGTLLAEALTKPGPHAPSANMPAYSGPQGQPAGTHTNASGLVGGFAHGGVIGEPSAIISLLSGRMLGTMAERGPERILPSDATARRLQEDYAQAASLAGVGLGMGARVAGGLGRRHEDMAQILEQIRRLRDVEDRQVGMAGVMGAGLAASIGNININWQGDAGNLRDRQRLAQDVGIMVLRMLADRMKQKGLVR